MGSLPLYLVFFHYIDNFLIQAGTKKIVHRVLIPGYVKIKHQPVEFQLSLCRKIDCRVAVVQQKTVHHKTAYPLEINTLIGVMKN